MKGGSQGQQPWPLMRKWLWLAAVMPPWVADCRGVSPPPHPRQLPLYLKPLSFQRAENPLTPTLIQDLQWTEVTPRQ